MRGFFFLEIVDRDSGNLYSNIDPEFFLTKFIFFILTQKVVIRLLPCKLI